MSEAWKGAITRVLSTSLPTNRSVRVLEAGGGKRSNIEIPHSRIVTVIDIDPAPLALNVRADEKIVGDIESHDYGDRKYDLIVCWDVLEHVNSPSAAVSRLSAALKPGGLFLIKGPVLTSLQGSITIATPHWLHIAFYRYVLGSPNAGKPGHAPFPIEFSREANDFSLKIALRACGLEILEFLRFEGPHAKKMKKRSAWLYFLYAASGRLIDTLKRDSDTSLNTDFFIIAQRPPDLLERSETAA